MPDMFHRELSGKHDVTMIFCLPYKVCPLQYPDRMNLNLLLQSFEEPGSICRTHSFQMLPLLLQQLNSTYVKQIYQYF